MEEKTIDEVLEENVWGPIKSDVRVYSEKKPKRRRSLFLGKRMVEAKNPVVFENGVFFVERGEEFLVIRPKTLKEYSEKVKVKSRKAPITEIRRVLRGPADIIIPLIALKNNPIQWFEEKYINNNKRDKQSRFIREIWNHRTEVFGEVITE